MKRNALRRLIGVTTTCTALILLLAAGSSFAQEKDIEQEVDVVWSKSDGIRPEIFYTNYSNGNWSEPEMISDDYYDNMHPVIDRDSTGNRWVFWRGYDSQRMEVRYTTGTAGDWQDVQPLADTLKSNSAPSVVIDQEDVVWVVWSGNDGGMDDIYYSKTDSGSFTDAQRLHGPNEGPDVLPVIELNEENRPVVSWRQLQKGKYVRVSSQFDGTDWSEPVLEQDDEEQESEEADGELVTLPDFITNSGIVFIRSY